MREALARADHDYVLAEPRRRSRRRGFFADAAERGRRALERAAKYTSIAAGAALAAVVVGILVNALALQKSHHPAPFFGHTFHLQVAAPAPAPTPEPTLRRVEVDPTPAAPAARGAVVQASQPKPVAPDPIGRLIKASPPPRPANLARPEASRAVPVRVDPIKAELAKSEAKAEAEKLAPSKAVAGAQRALVKLGFVLRADGMMGAATRQAIEQFERDRGLQAHGELTPRVIRELATQSGVAIQ